MESPEGDSGRCGGMRVMSTDAEVDAGNKQLRTHRVTSGSSTPLKIDRSLLLKVLEEIAVHYLRRIADKTDGINHVFGVEDYHAFLINLRKKKMVRWVSGAVKESLTPRGTHDSAPVCTGNKQFVAAKKYYRGHTVTPNDLEKKLSSPIEVFAREAYRRGVPDRKAFLMKLHDNGFCEVAMFVYDGAEFGLRREGRVEWVPMKDIQERQHVIKSEIKNEDRQEEDEDDFIDVGGEGDNGGRLSGGSSAVTGCPSPHSEAEPCSPTDAAPGQSEAQGGHTWAVDDVPFPSRTESFPTVGERSRSAQRKIWIRHSISIDCLGQKVTESEFQKNLEGLQIELYDALKKDKKAWQWVLYDSLKTLGSSASQNWRDVADMMDDVRSESGDFEHTMQPLPTGEQERSFVARESAEAEQRRRLSVVAEGESEGSVHGHRSSPPPPAADGTLATPGAGDVEYCGVGGVNGGFEGVAGAGAGADSVSRVAPPPASGDVDNASMSTSVREQARDVKRSMQEIARNVKDAAQNFRHEIGHHVHRHRRTRLQSQEDMHRGRGGNGGGGAGWCRRRRVQGGGGGCPGERGYDDVKSHEDTQVSEDATAVHGVAADLDSLSIGQPDRREIHVSPLGGTSAAPSPITGHALRRASAAVPGVATSPNMGMDVEQGEPDMAVDVEEVDNVFDELLSGENSPLNVGPGHLRRTFTEMVCGNELNESADKVVHKRTKRLIDMVFDTETKFRRETDRHLRR